jgi:hypothetical protein
MAYTKYSLTPADNNAAPPNGAPEGMLPSAVNDTMRDMMAQIRDVGDGIRGGTYTMTAPVITGGSITGVALSGNTFTSPVITGGSINNTPIGATTANTGAFTTLGATGVATFSAGTVSAPAITTTGDTNTGIFFPAADTIAFAEGGVEAMRIDSSANVGIGTSSPTNKFVVSNGGAAGFEIGPADGNGVAQYAYNRSTSAWANAAYYANQHLFYRAGTTEAMRIDSSGNVGIGTSSPSNIVEVSRNQNAETQVRLYNANAGSGARTVLLLGNNSSAGAAGIFLNSSTYSGGGGANALTLYMGLSAPITFETNATERMRIDSSGNVFIGGASFASYKLGVYGDIRAVNAGYTMGGTYTIQASDVGIGRESNGGMIFGTNGSERMRIDSSGNLMVGTTAVTSGVTASQLYVKRIGTQTTITADQTGGTGGYNYSSNATNNGGVYYHFNFLEANTQRGSITSNGTSTTYSTSSDYRLKENIAPMTGALGIVQQLKPVTYKWKADGSDGQGFIAHELQAVVPDCVTGEKDAVDAEGNPVYQGIDTSFLVATLTAALQEAHGLIKDLQAKVETLEAK